MFAYYTYITVHKYVMNYYSMYVVCTTVPTMIHIAYVHTHIMYIIHIMHTVNMYVLYVYSTLYKYGM
jgi:hypothetical protein